MVLSFYLSTTLEPNETLCDQLGGTARSDFLAINTVKRCVVWYSAGGNRVVRHFSYHKVPQAALFCQFQSPSDSSGSASARNAVAVLVSPSDLCINMFTGEVYNIKMPYPIKRMLSIPLGLLFQAQLSNQRDALFGTLEEQDCRYFTLSNPSAPLQSLNLNGSLTEECLTDLQIQCVEGSNICMYSESQNALLMWQLNERTTPLPGLNGLAIASNHDGPTSRSLLDSALDIVDGSKSQYSSLMPSKSDTMSMLLLSDTFQAGGNESFRADRFIDSSSSTSLFNTSASTASSRRSLGGERTLNDLHQASALARDSSASPVHMILDKSSFHTSSSGAAAAAAGVSGLSHVESSPLPGTTRGGHSGGQPFGPTRRETSTQPYHLTTSPGSLMTGSAFQRSVHSTQLDDSSVPMNISRSNASRSQVHQSLNTTLPLESSGIEVKANGEFEMKLAQLIPLPEGTSADLQCSFSGSALQLGGLLFHCLDRQSGRYVVYRVQSNESEVAYSLLHTGKGYSSLSHVTLPLENTHHCLRTDQCGMTVDSVQTHIPLTLLLKSDSTTAATVSVVIGSTVVGEVPLVWENDFFDNVCCDEDVESISVLQQASTQIILRTAKNRHIVSLQKALFGSISGGGLGSLVNAEADLVKALVAHYGPSSEGVVEYALGLLMAGADSRQKFLHFLCASCGVPFQTLQETDNRLNAIPNFAIFLHCYNSLSNKLSVYCPEGRSRLDSVRLCHVLLQEYSLRFDQLPSGGIHLRESFVQLVVLLEKSNLAHLFGAFYGVYHPTHQTVTVDPTLNSSLWFKHCLTLLTAHSADFTEFPLPSTLNALSLQPYPTLRLSSLFFKYLLSDASTSDSMQQSATRIVNSFVSSVLHPFVSCGRDAPELEWLGLLSLMPGLLKTMIQLSLEQCAEVPSRHWPNFVLREIGRNDLCVGNHAARQAGLRSTVDKSSTVVPISTRDDAVSHSDGLQEVETASRLRFTEDERMHEVCRMLRSSSSVYLKLEKAPEVSDFDHKAKLQQKLLSLCRRLLACPIGRGMLTMSTLEPLIAEALPIPTLTLSGRVAPSKLVMDLETSLAHADLTLWPEFHNGVAAALRVGPTVQEESGGGAGSSSAKVTRNWIIYNRTASQAKTGGESSHAGFLFGLGLHGHLSVLSVTDICDYLVQGHEPTTIAILLGSTASKVGSADPLLSKTLSLHLPALLPAQHWDIEISPLVQTAALVGMGLLHCSSGHRVMTEFLLAELSRKPTSDRCESREAMVLASCWSLGMVLLGKGNEKSFYNPKSRAKMPLRGAGVLGGLSDLRVEERLLLHIDGGKKPAESSLFPSHASSVDVSSKSSRVLEGDDINVDVTAPGACIALALIYLRSNNAEILNRLNLPVTLVQLDSIRPDLLMFRAVARTLIMWDAVEPTEEWIHSQVPTVVMQSLFISEAPKTPEEQAKAKVEALFELYNKSHRRSNRQLEGKTAFSLYLSTVSGFCWGLGLVYAGSLDERAKKTIMDKLLLLQSFRDNKPLIKVPFTLDKSQRYTLEMCIGIVSVSLSCVMAGSGDLDCLRLLRELRFRVDDVSYGTHLAIAMAIGLLFLAGGNSSLRRDPLSTACLLLAMCPRFPSRSVDHQYHLQPLRHLYVLATEDRALHTIDVDTGKPVALNVEVELLDGSKTVLRAPGLLPELQTVRRVSVTVESQLQPLQQSLQAGADAVAEKSEFYYPTALEFNETVAARVVKSIFTVDRGFHRSMHSRRSVPVLLVKKVPSTNSRDEHTATSAQHIAALDSVRSILQQSLEPVHYKRIQEHLHQVATNSVLSYQVNRCVLEDLLVYLKKNQSTEDGLGDIIIRCKPFLDVLTRTLTN